MGDRRARQDDVGRLLIVGYQGRDFSPELERIIEDIRPAGLIFFRRNYPADPDPAAALERLLKTIGLAGACAFDRSGRRLLMCVDHEGGLVQRLPFPFLKLPSAQEVAESMPPAGAEELAFASGRELAAAGFNFNMAPVLDIRAPESNFVASRGYGEDPESVALYASAARAGYRRAGLLTVGKHFPGLGAAVADPHHELPVIETPAARILDYELRPFRGLMAEGLEAVMSTHALYPALDPERPATFSPALVEILRRRLNFHGALLTDDLEMGAVVNNYPMGQAAVEAVAAGHDLALVCSQADYVYECRDALAEAVRGGRLGPDRLAEAHGRLGALLGLAEKLAPPPEDLAAWRAALRNRGA